MTTLASITGGTIAGLVTIGLVLLLCLGGAALGALAIYDREPAAGAGWIIGSLAVALLCLGGWWWGMAFTTSSDYHAWNVKEGTVEKVSKRLVSNGDKGMSERFVVVMDGQPYGIDDTRASLVKVGDQVSLRCKKDYQWGVPREAHGWACRWNGTPEG